MAGFDPRSGACTDTAAACRHLRTIVDQQVAASTETLCAVFDIDDTLLLHTESSVGRNNPVCDLLKHCASVGVRVHVITARPESTRGATQRDLSRVAPVYDTLHMLPPSVERSGIGLWKFVTRWHCLMTDAETHGHARMIFSIGDQGGDLLRDDEQIDKAMDIFPSSSVPYIVTATPPMEPATILAKLPAQP